MSTELAARRTSISREDFRALFRRHPGAVCIVTVSGPGGIAGFTATSVVSVSAEPSVLAFSISLSSSAWPALTEAERVTVHFLDQSHTDLGVRFATPDIDRFDGVTWTLTPEHGALLSGIDTWATGTIASTTPLTASALICVAIDDSSVHDEHDALVYRDREYVSIQPSNPLG